MNNFFLDIKLNFQVIKNYIKIFEYMWIVLKFHIAQGQGDV